MAENRLPVAETSLKDYFGEENTAELSVLQKKIKRFLTRLQCTSSAQSIT
ncbi:hypothetical protein ODZ84_22550 [Chryseobacterium fluminis]|nr:hypothetical protein [Chryseobacterium sp. MMS21-Ot14]UZT97916.1 hypothetical protein ODZ84_22550 [Chryseobacterium sp. MMS21-Ot14]